jgi:hypothetical protein
MNSTLSQAYDPINMRRLIYSHTLYLKNKNIKGKRNHCILKESQEKIEIYIKEFWIKRMLDLD